VWEWQIIAWHRRLCVFYILFCKIFTFLTISVGKQNALAAVTNMGEPQKLQNLASYFTSCPAGKANPLLGVLANTKTAITAIQGLQCADTAAKTQIDNICAKNSVRIFNWCD
jgi:hypothetical protein